MMAANCLFATMTIAARLASASAGWATVGGARALGGALVAAAFALGRGRTLRTSRPVLSWARSIFGTLSMLTTFYALSSRELAVGDAVTLFATAPLFIALLSPVVLRERTDPALWGVLVFAFVGVMLVAGPHFIRGGGTLVSLGRVPAISAFLAAVFSATAMMFLRMMRAGHGGGPPDSPEAIAFHFATLGFVVHAAIASLDFHTPTLRDSGFLALAGVSGGLAQLAMTRAYALAPAAKLGAVGYAGTVLGFAGAIVFLGERPGWLQLVGATLVVGAGVVLALISARGHAAGAPPLGTSTSTAPGAERPERV